MMQNKWLSAAVRTGAPAPQAARLRGGVWLDPLKTPLLERPVGVLRAPQRLVVPLRQLAGPAPELCVEAGARVLLGEPLARGAGDGCGLHSPVSGVVAEISPFGSDPADLCVVLENDGKDTAYPSAAKPEKELSAALRATAAAASGAPGTAGGVRPLGAAAAALKSEKTRVLVLNAVETEPYLCVSQKLLDEQPDEIAAGFLLLLEAAGARAAVLAVGDDVPGGTVDAFTAAARMRGLAVQVEHVPQKYPYGDERYLRTLLRGRGAGAAASPAGHAARPRYGFVAPEDCLLALRALSGEPQVTRLLPVAGDAVASPQILEVRIGTPVEAVLEHCGLSFEPDRVVLGGPMRGAAITDLAAPVTKATQAVLALKAPHARASRSLCINCGKCVSVCPEGLLPNYIAQSAVTADFDVLRELHIADCVECGCCTYVCPGRMPIVELIKNIKKAAE